MAGTLVRPEIEVEEMGIFAATAAHARDDARLALQARDSGALAGRACGITPAAVRLHARGGS